MADGSVSGWISRLGRGDELATREIWSRYAARLESFSRRRLGATPRRTFDEEDVALSALQVFFHGVRAGQFAQIRDRHQLWCLLAQIADRKIHAQRRRAAATRRGVGPVQERMQLARAAGRTCFPVEHVADRAWQPELQVEFVETYQQMLQALGDPGLRRIAEAKLTGFSNAEIARRIRRSVATVERRLQRIRTIWAAAGYGPARSG